MSDLTHVFLLTYASGPDCDAECADILEAGDVFRTLDGAKAAGRAMILDEFEEVEDDLEWQTDKRDANRWFLVLDCEATAVIRRVALGA